MLILRRRKTINNLSFFSDVRAYHLVLLLALSSVFTHASADEKPIRFGTFPIPQLVVDENSGNFVALTREIARRAGMDIEIVVLPPKRVLRQFMDNKIDALFPALDVYFTPDSMPTRTAETLFIKEDFIFSRKGEPFITTLESIEGVTVGVTQGYPYSPALTDNPRINIEEAPSDWANVIKLMKKRTDAFVVEGVAGVEAFRSEGALGQVQYDPDSPISAMDVYYAFQNTEEGHKLATLFSTILSAMKKDGSYSAIITRTSQSQLE